MRLNPVLRSQKLKNSKSIPGQSELIICSKQRKCDEKQLKKET